MSRVEEFKYKQKTIFVGEINIMEEIVLRTNYKPGRTVEELNRDKLRVNLLTTGEERIMKLLSMIEVSQCFKKAKTNIQKM